MAGTSHKSVIAIVAAVVVIVIGYFVYDRTRNPCDSIFEQASTSLSAKLDLLKTGAEVAIGKAQIQDLTERSQMMALNLKTCCIVFDGGKLNSGEFLKCRQGVERYETQVTQIVNLVSEARAASAAGQAQVVETKAQETTRAVEAARQAASAFQSQVAQIAGQSAPSPAPSPAPATSEPKPAVNRPAVGGAEAEPNNSAFEANRLAVDSGVTGEVADARDSDWYRLTPGSKLRDWMTVKLENRSQTLRPYLLLYDADKNQLGGQEAGNNGANAEYAIVVAPGAEYYAQVGGKYGSTGAYGLTVSLRQAFDRYEANDDAFTAKEIGVGAAVDANIMDGADVDWYRVKAPAAAAMTVRLENRSSTLRPWVTVYDWNKKEIAGQAADNNGQNLEFSVKAEAGKDHYVVTGGRYRSTGDYRLTVGGEN